MCIPVIKFYLFTIKNLIINTFLSDICIVLKVLKLPFKTAFLSEEKGFEQKSLNWCDYVGTLILWWKFCGYECLEVGSKSIAIALYSEPDDIVSFFFVFSPLIRLSEVRFSVSDLH